MTYAFFPGCSLDGAAKDYHRSTLAVAAKLGLELPELKDWICCGSTAAHSSDPLLADALPAKSLSAAGGSTVAVACAACYSRLKTANHHIAQDAALRARVAHVVGRDYDGRTPVLHLLEILGRDIGLARVAAAIRRPLAGLKVACYYGCLLVRPPEITNFDDPENPTLMDQLMRSRRGGAARVAAQDRVLRRELLHHRFERRAGAGQPDSRHGAGGRSRLHRHRLPPVPTEPGHAAEGYGAQVRTPVQRLPVFYFTQLLGLAMGCRPDELSLGQPGGGTQGVACGQGNRTLRHDYDREQRE